MKIHLRRAKTAAALLLQALAWAAQAEPPRVRPKACAVPGASSPWGETRDACGPAAGREPWR